MKTLMIALAVATVMTGSAIAAEKYDRSIDAAAARIVAERIGGLRGGFAFGERPAFVAVADEVTASAASQADIAHRPGPGGWDDGLARAHDPVAPATSVN